MEKDKESIYDISTWRYFFVLCLATLTLLVVKKTFVENATFAFEILEQRGEMGVFHAINTLQYFTIPLVYLVKFTVISFAIWIGCFMYGYKLTFTSTWKIVMISETLFLIPEFIKICWFLFVFTNANLNDIRSFYPLSMISLFDTTSLPDYTFYPLKALNIFEVIYWFVLVYGIHKVAGKKKHIAYAIVFSSYVLFFFLWLGFYSLVF